RSNRRRIPNIVEPEIQTITEIIPMADRTSTHGRLVQDNKFHGREKDNPHTHISNFKMMTATLKYRDISNDAIKLMLFSYSLEDRARILYEKEPPNLILTWDDLINKFVNQFFPPSKTTHLKNEISCFKQRFEETFSETWDRFKELLRACPHHRFSELTQIDTFYNGLTEQDQDSLNAASGGNLLNKTAREALQIIENKSKEENLRRNLNDDMRNILSSFFQNQPSTSGTLPSNTIPNPKGEMKAVTTRSGLAYEGSTAQVQLLVVPISILEPDVPRTQTKPTIPYPSSFANALLLMPKFASTIKSLLANKDKLFELAKVPLNENCSAMLLKKLPEKLGDPELTPTRMTLELADRSITCPKGVAEDVFVKVGKFHFPIDFVVVDFEADPRVPLILGRPIQFPPMDLKIAEESKEKSSVEEPPELELKELP
nr:reverse transcriptase domain-containing protein [Tanacetum cinerariifolium]